MYIWAMSRVDSASANSPGKTSSAFLTDGRSSSEPSGPVSVISTRGTGAASSSHSQSTTQS